MVLRPQERSEYTRMPLPPVFCTARPSGGITFKLHPQYSLYTHQALLPRHIPRHIPHHIPRYIPCYIPCHIPYHIAYPHQRQ